MNGSRLIPADLLAALEAAYRDGADLRPAVAPIVAALHGTRASYTSGCRCDECTAANTEYCVQNRRPKYAAKLAADPDSFPHGSDSTYANYGCRCEPCVEAHSAKGSSAAANRAARLAADPTIRPHGVAATYFGWGCRCPECTAAAAVENRKRYQARKERAMT